MASIFKETLKLRAVTEESVDGLHLKILGMDGNSKKISLEISDVYMLPNKMQGFIPSKARLYL